VLVFHSFFIAKLPTAEGCVIQLRASIVLWYWLGNISSVRPSPAVIIDIYVLEGTLEYEIDGRLVTVKPGDVLFVPAGTIHSVKNVGTSNGAELATYVVEKGKPLFTLVK